MDVERFIHERRHRWARLETLLDAADRMPAWELGRERVLEIVWLYRQACSDLNQARALTANPELLGRLNQLTGRAYRLVHGPAARRARPGAVRRFFAEDAPRALRRSRKHLLAAALSMVFGSVVGFCGVVLEPASARLLVPAEFFIESPRERVAQIERGDERVDDLEKALLFGASLYAHNIKVSLLVFSLAVLTIAGAHALLLYNGIILGAIAALHHVDGVTTFFVAWVGPHGALELPAIVVSATAGLALGHAFLLPGDRTRARALREATPDACRVLGVAVSLLVVAGLIEGSFSQFTARTVPFAVKIGVAASLLVGLCAWLAIAGRAGEARKAA